MDAVQIKKRFLTSIRYTVAGVNQLLWPAVCLICRESISEGDNGLCRNCWDELAECTAGDYCPRCGRDASRFALVAGACAACQALELHFDAIARAGVYAKSLQHMILAYKHGQTDLGSMLARLADSALQGSAFRDRLDLLVPVPLHWTRRLARGYNQSLVLARRIKPPTAKISTELVRMRRTKMQPVMATDAARRRNVAGAFAVRKGHPFNGKTICLIDDIKTTGATLNECARVLKQAGAEKVYALVLAVAGQRIN